MAEHENNPKEVTSYEFNKKLSKITAELSNQPLKKERAVNKFADGAEYLPIEIVESKLDLYFPLSWQTTNFQWGVVANELVGSLELHVWNPVLRQWITRTGTGGVPIQMRSEDKGGSGDLTDVNNKVKVTLQKDFPHLKSEALKNAAKSLGQTFGRDLNRDTSTDPVQLDDIAEILSQIEAIEDKQMLIDYYKDLPNLAKQSSEIQSKFKAQKLKIEYGNQKQGGNDE
jgi:hypothetical protein